MITLCKDHLTTVLNQSGVAQVGTQAEDLTKHHGLPYAVILEGDERLVRDRRRVAKTDDLVAKKRTYRWQIYKRIVPVTVHLFAKDTATLASAFLAALGTRILDQAGNAVLIAAAQAQPTDDRSLIQQKEKQEIQVEFTGGVYEDRVIDLVPLTTGLVLETEIIKV